MGIFHNLKSTILFNQIPFPKVNLMIIPNHQYHLEFSTMFPISAYLDHVPTKLFEWQLSNSYISLDPQTQLNGILLPIVDKSYISVSPMCKLFELLYFWINSNLTTDPFMTILHSLQTQFDSFFSNELMLIIRVNQ